MFKQYDEIILQYILNRAGGVLKPPTGDLKYPYIDPGAGVRRRTVGLGFIFYGARAVPCVQRFACGASR